MPERSVTRAIALCILATPCTAPGADLAPPPRLVFHAPPKPLARDAVTSDWPRFLGPTDDGRSPETRLARAFPPGGPPLVWELARGEGYASPIVAGGRLVLFHRIADREIVECRDAESGAPLWQHDDPTDYRDKFNYNGGPRSSPTIADGKVYTFGVTGLAHALDLQTGAPLWQKDLRAAYRIPDNFFGLGSSPLVHGRVVVINAGGAEGRSVVALDRDTGEEVWAGGGDWGNSYASPIVTRLHGSERILVFAGGESDPPTGGLLCIDPTSGSILARFPWRADRVYSVNASTPLPLGDDSVLLAESYDRGAVALRFSEDLTPSKAWVAPRFRLHFMTPILRDGHIYGIDGEHRRNATLACLEAKSGRELWREAITWQIPIGGETVDMGVYRGNLIEADGRVLCLGELGSLLWLDLSPGGCRILARAQLFIAQETWAPPAISRGLLYVHQNAIDPITRTGPRTLCYDLRESSP